MSICDLHDWMVWLKLLKCHGSYDSGHVPVMPSIGSTKFATMPHHVCRRSI